ncbi:putative nuclease HARBI1 [Ornithodoros turicata]|uniref:putative nuclease HARBI1 n=1 Tax=Ornithodoros turicata TaxID=34597 RepID=UPI0031391E2C
MILNAQRALSYCGNNTSRRFPTGDEAGSVKETFLRKGGFPGIVGAVDGTHTRIQAPIQHEENYINRKGFHSLNVQVVVDANSYITKVVAKWPGSVHDSRILRSSIGERFESGHIRGMLLGDSGYPCRPWLMTPFLRPNGHAQEMYNEAHKTSRSVVVERAIGQLKRRFACLHGEFRHLNVAVALLLRAASSTIWQSSWEFLTTELSQSFRMTLMSKSHNGHHKTGCTYET